MVVDTNVLHGIFHVSTFTFIMNVILFGGLAVSAIALYIMKKKPEKDYSVKQNRVEARAEINRRKQEDDELTALINAANDDAEYQD